MDNEFNMNKLPAAGNPRVGAFFYALFDQAYQERQRLGLDERFHENHRLFRGSHWLMGRYNVKPAKHRVPVNLFFANIQRTVANITARAPVAEVVSLDGIQDGADVTLSTKLKSWWNEAEQGVSLARSSLNMEIYGITPEKAVYDFHQKRSYTVVLDPYAFVPAPGYYEEINDMPYICHICPMYPDEIESQFGVPAEKIQEDDVYSILGEDREENVPIPYGTRLGTQNYPGNFSSITHPTPRDKTTSRGRALVVEIWIRDRSTEEVEVEKTIVDPYTGKEIPVKVVEKQSKYPGNIRVVTLTNRGALVLDDKANPNINPSLPPELAKETYLYDHYPFYKANSYEDTTSIWGFSAAEQVGDINKLIDEMLSRIALYVNRTVTPILIVPMDTGITREMITTRPGLVLQPTSAASSPGIRFLQVPNLPENFFSILEIYVKFFDRISQIEDADRGKVPNRVVSGAAIYALQERGAVLIRAKIRAVDYLVRQRGRCSISFIQNFGTQPELLEVQGETKVLKGVDLAGRKFNYVVESGSTVARTSLQIMEQAEQLYKVGAIDRQALLENLNFPGWKEIIERVGEGQLGQAIQILIQAGLPEEVGKALYQQLMMPQGGPGNRPQQPPAGGEETRTGGAPTNILQLLKAEQGTIPAGAAPEGGGTV
jgi:hypothetical protein